MAFIGRGGNFPRRNGGLENSNPEYNDGYKIGFVSGYLHNRIHSYVPLDNIYVIMQMIATIIIAITAFISFLITYQSQVIDPIEGLKKSFINTYLIILGIILLSNFIIHFISKTEKILIKRLAIILLISIISLLVFFCIRINLDKKYTEEKFEQIYLEINQAKQISEEKNKISLSLKDMGLKTEKEFYVLECKKSYNVFITRTYIILGLHLLLNFLLLYQISKLNKKFNKKERLNKDDLILFDEEQNIKY